MKKLLIASTVALLSLGLCFSSAVAEDDIVFGESALVTGVFAFAGAEFHEGLADYINFRNDNGGIKGRKIKHVFEDCGYKVDCSVAAFKKIHSENKPLFYSGDSTGFAKAINPELLKAGDVVMSGLSYASDLADEKAYPKTFMLGPSYADQMKILLTYVAKEKPAAKIAIVHSDSGFGRDPIEAGKATAKELGLEVVEVITTKPGSVNVTTEVLKLRRKKPDYILFHGYVLSPMNEFMQQIRDLGLDTKFMGTYWSSSELTYMKGGESADGYLGAMHLNYFNMEKSPGKAWDEMRAYNKKAHPDKTSRPNFYVSGWFQGLVWAEVIERTIDAGKELKADNLRATLNSIENWDTQGIAAVPVTFRNNSIPFGRIVKANIAEQKYDVVSDVIEIK
jgi:branched-chain amino acid transport system substrate-binding protein